MFFFDIAAGTTTRIPHGSDEVLYGPSVDAQGTMYYGKSGLACGENVQVIARELDGAETVLYDVPAGFDFQFSIAVDNGDGTTDIYYDQEDCSSDDFGDIWRLEDI